MAVLVSFVESSVGPPLPFIPVVTGLACRFSRRIWKLTQVQRLTHQKQKKKVEHGDIFEVNGGLKISSSLQTELMVFCDVPTIYH